MYHWGKDYGYSQTIKNVSPGDGWIPMLSCKPDAGYKAIQGGTWSNVLTPEEEMKKLVNEATTATTAYIQSEVDKYNSGNGVVFVNVHSCANYINNPTYTHYQFCSAVWNWNVDVWEEARLIQSRIASGEIPVPETPEEFIAMLPVFEWVT